MKVPADAGRANPQRAFGQPSYRRTIKTKDLCAEIAPMRAISLPIANSDGPRGAYGAWLTSGNDWLSMFKRKRSGLYEAAAKVEADNTTTDDEAA